MKKITPKKSKELKWDLGHIYKSHSDPQIEKDIADSEKSYAQFAETYDTSDKSYQSDASSLLQALEAYEKLSTLPWYNGITYFSLMRDTDAQNKVAGQKIALIENRLIQMLNKVTFFPVTLGRIDPDLQKKFLTEPSLTKYHVFLGRMFADGAHQLTVPEEKILSLKSQPAHSMWTAGSEKILNQKNVTWKGKKISLGEASKLVFSLKSSDRTKLSSLINKELKDVAPFAEAEINAIYTNKKIEDALRGFEKPFDATVLSYRNDPQVVEQLVKVVTESFSVSHSFYKIKARLLKQKTLRYTDRGVKLGTTKSAFSFDQSVTLLSEILTDIDPKLNDILQTYIRNRQLDTHPRVGKAGGAYCAGSYLLPTFVLLNHTDDLLSFKTFAHEMGHAIHTELSRAQGPIYSEYSYSLAETASTLFESIALEKVFERLSDKEKIIALHDRISDNISTVMRQIACFNFELDIHNAVRAKGYIDHPEIAALHNKRMKEYLGPVFKLEADDGYMFVQWSHIRRFFYVYSYAYGMLVSKAMLRRYKKDPSFWSSIERFLTAGGKDSPEAILKEIGIDVNSPEFWKEGIQEMADDIKLLDKLSKQLKK